MQNIDVHQKTVIILHETAVFVTIYNEVLQIFQSVGTTINDCEKHAVSKAYIVPFLALKEVFY